jgi:hypothetical protein
MAKTKPVKPKVEPNEIRSTVIPGELFVRTTYVRLYKQKHGLSEIKASNLFEKELKSGSVVFSHEWSGIKIYKKT